MYDILSFCYKYNMKIWNCYSCERFYPEALMSLVIFIYSLIVGDFVQNISSVLPMP